MFLSISSCKFVSAFFFFFLRKEKKENRRAIAADTGICREDAATAEVSRSQLWQWARHGSTTAEGKKVTKAYALKLLKESADELASKAGPGNKYHLAAQYFAGQVTGEDYADFLTT